MLSNRDQNLPEDVVNEILSRLPMKSLLRFKYACSPEDIGNVVGPIDGIFLLYIPGYYSNSDRMALWNPAMREFNRLHVLEPIFPPNFHAITNVVEFGLDPLTRDYKIIWIRDFVETIGDETYDLYYPYHVAAIYTLGKDSWRHFDLLTIPKDRTIYNSLCAACINGASYWLSGRGFWKEEHLLESQTNKLVLYNHETHEIRNLEIYECGNTLGQCLDKMMGMRGGGVTNSLMRTSLGSGIPKPE
ncbi:unnamed protein product [Camellia sinensis]